MIRNENVERKEKKVRIKVDRAKSKNSAIDGSNEKSTERDSLRMTRRRSTLIQFIQRRFLGDTSSKSTYLFHREPVRSSVDLFYLH